MGSKNLKTKVEEVKVKAPQLIQEADELRAESDRVSTKAHAHAGLAYLFELILRDPVHPTLAKLLMQAFKSESSQREEPFELSELLELEAQWLHMHPVLLAVAMIWWGKEADIAENETVGRADWQLVPISIRNHRTDLQKEFRLLFEEIELLFRGSGLEPELGIQLLRKKCQAIDHALLTVLKSIEGHRSKRKKLFYANSKNEIEAYYLLRIRRLKTTAKEVANLLSNAGEAYDMSDSKNRHRAQRKLHEWADGFEIHVDALMLDLGYVRTKREYAEVSEPDLDFLQ